MSRVSLDVAGGQWRPRGSNRRNVGIDTDITGALSQRDGCGPACAVSVTKAHPSGYGDNGKYGLDCSGFVRWVYFLVYGQDVLGPGTTAAQQSQPALAKVPAAQRQTGHLVFFPGHVGIYAGNGIMVDEPHTYDPPSGPTGFPGDPD